MGWEVGNGGLEFGTNLKSGSHTPLFTLELGWVSSLTLSGYIPGFTSLPQVCLGLGLGQGKGEEWQTGKSWKSSWGI